MVNMYSLSHTRTLSHTHSHTQTRTHNTLKHTLSHTHKHTNVNTHTHTHTHTQGHVKMVNLLLDKGADKSIKNKVYISPPAPPFTRAL